MGLTVNIPTEVGQELSATETTKAPSEAVVKAALDKKLNVNQLPANILLYPTNAEADLVGFFRMVSSVEDPDFNTVAVDISTGTITGADQLLAELVADANLFIGNPGVINIATIGNVKKVSGGANTYAEFYFKVYHRNDVGDETLIGTSGKTPQVEGTTYQQFNAVAMVNNGVFTATDRLVIRYYGTKIGGGGSPVYSFQFGGSDPVRSTLPIPASLLVDLPIHIGSTQVIDGTDGKLLKVTGGRVDEVTADKTLVGLGNVDNTSDADKPVSTATQTALNGKSNTGHIHAISDITGLQTALDAKQATLVSGTNIKTVGGVSILGAGDIPVSSGIVVGTTVITSGVDTRVLFQSSGKVSESANFTYDDTLKRLKLKSVGTGTTDYPFVVENSAGTFNDFTINGRGKVSMTFNSSTDGFFFDPQNAEFSQVAYSGVKIQSLTNSVGYFGFGVGAYKLGIGTNSPQARMDIKTQGALSTDIGLKVGNSAGTDNILTVKGDQSIDFLGAGTGGYLNLARSAGSVTLKHRATATLPSLFKIQSIGDGGSIGQIQLDAFDGNTPAFTVQRLLSGLTDLTASAFYSAFGTNTAAFVMKNASGYGGYGTDPSGTAADHFAMYAKDIVAGNSAPHFRTENGSIIKLFKGSALTVSDGTLANAVTRIGEIEARLTALGLI